MQNERLEFFKLDPTDRKVLFWLMDNVDLKSLKGWMEYIASDYREIQSTNDELRSTN